MIYRRGGPRLAREAGAEGWVACELGGDQLHRDRPIERELPGPIDHAHAAAADRRLDPAAGDHRAACEHQQRARAGRARTLAWATSHRAMLVRLRVPVSCDPSAGRAAIVTTSGFPAMVITPI